MYFAVNIISFILSVILSNHLYSWAFRQKFVAIPNSRSYHSSHVPSFGGIIISVTVMAVLILFSAWMGIKVNPWFLIAYMLIIGIGILDDLMDIIPIQKIIVEIFASLILVWGSDLFIGNLFGFFSFIVLSDLWSTVLTVLFILLTINSINFIDGIDGLAGVFGIVASVVYTLIFFLAGEVWLVLFSLALVGALAGFLIFNFSHRRKIFMGDAGSLSLGFVLAFFALKAINLQPFEPFQNPSEMFLLGMSILIIPVFDVVRLFFSRLANGKSPFQADNNHIHHLFVRNLKMSHRRSAVVIVFFNFILTNATFWSLKYLDINLAVIIYFLIFLGYCSLMKLLSGYQKEILLPEKVFK